MATAAKGKVECRYCLDKGDCVDNPKMLPCSHIYCSRCLQKKLAVMKVIRCGICRVSYDLNVDELPSLDEANILCEPCRRKDLTVKAVVYCQQCDTKFCKRHRETHKEMLEDKHMIIDIEEYSQIARRHPPRHCAKHVTEHINLACAVCNSVLCGLCLDGGDKCKGGSAHQAVALTVLVSKVRNEVEDLMLEAQEKEDQLVSLIKLCSQIESDYDDETRELLRTLHKTRDDQIEAIKEKYERLEEELLTCRTKTKDSVVQFMEDKVGVRLLDLSAEILKLEARARDSHEVDIVDSFSQTEKLLRQLIEEELPSLTINYSAKLDIAGVNRSIELELTHSDTITVIKQPELYSKLKIPKSFELIREVEVSFNNYNKGYILQGKTGVITRYGVVYQMDEHEHFATTCSVQSLSSINSVAAHNDKLCLLDWGKPSWRVGIVTAAGELIVSWNHQDRENMDNQLTLVGDKIVIPDRSKDRLTVYSVKGEVIKQISLLQIANSATYICTAEEDSVIVAARECSQILRMNIISNQVMWTSSEVSSPCSLVCYGKDHLLVSDNKNRLHVLNSRTGAYQGELVNESNVAFDTKYSNLCLENDILIAHKYNKVLFYKLK